MNEPSNFVRGSEHGCPNNDLENPPYVPGEPLPRVPPGVGGSSQGFPFPGSGVSGLRSSGQQAAGEGRRKGRRRRGP